MIHFADFLYDSWVKESVKVFSSFSDEDFFSDKVQHIYFYSDINDDSVNELQNLLQEASKTKKNGNIYAKPKPICLHLNSSGGSIDSTNIFYTIIQTQRIPLCVVIETVCASGATNIGLLAPYRVMIDFSSYLIHDALGPNMSTKSTVVKSDYIYLEDMVYYQNLLTKRTSLTQNEIKNFMNRDIELSADYCLSKKIIDRILRLPKINSPDHYKNVSNLQLSLSSFLKKTNLNHIYISNDVYNTSPIISDIKMFTTSLNPKTNIYQLCIALDKLFLMKNNNVKPIVLHFKSSTSDSAMFEDANPYWLIQLNYRLALIQKKLPVIAFIEGHQSLDLLSTIMMCPIRIMMKPSILRSSFTYQSADSVEWAVTSKLKIYIFLLFFIVFYIFL
jgi:ATP-dependent protease ClpP protease subunit